MLPAHQEANHIKEETKTRSQLETLRSLSTPKDERDNFANALLQLIPEESRKLAEGYLTGIADNITEYCFDEAYRYIKEKYDKPPAPAAEKQNTELVYMATSDGPTFSDHEAVKQDNQ